MISLELYHYISEYYRSDNRVGKADKIDYYTDGLKLVIKLEVKYWGPQILAAAIEIATQYNSAMWRITKKSNLKQNFHNTK